jgi:hypothetical protein
LLGLPIFKANSEVTKKDEAELWYESDNFKAATNLKSKVVLQVLNAGYSVVWSDVDITWFVHPFDAMAGYMSNPTKFAFQSNSPYVANPGAAAVPHDSVGPVKTQDPTDGQWGLNSGLFIVANSKLGRSAFEEIADHVSTTKSTEQQSFNTILCGRYPSERSSSSCIYRPERHLHFPRDAQAPVESLDRFSFPNGAVLVGESNLNVYKLGRTLFEKETGGKRLYAANNNWIEGEGLKKARQQETGLWVIDESDSCSYLQKDHRRVGPSL